MHLTRLWLLQPSSMRFGGCLPPHLMWICEAKGRAKEFRITEHYPHGGSSEGAGGGSKNHFPAFFCFLFFVWDI